VVDDVIVTRELQRNILSSAGYDVDVAVDGLEALEKMGQETYDLVVADVEMPRMDGFALTEALRADERYADIPVVIVSARETEADRRRGIEVGAQAYIVKSAFDQENLLAIIEQLIG
jgi:CheY-like chemotaxis protein